MTRTILSAVFLLAASSVWAENEPSLLYWMVTDSNVEFECARVAATRGEVTSYLSIWNEEERKPQEGYSQVYSDQTHLNTDPKGEIWRSYMGGTTDWTQYSFCIELLNDEFAVIGWSDSVSYDQLEGLRAIEVASKVEPMGSWTVSSFSTVPEPTSGLLMLFGIAALALRREKTA